MRGAIEQLILTLLGLARYPPGLPPWFLQQPWRYPPTPDGNWGKETLRFKPPAAKSMHGPPPRAPRRPGRPSMMPSDPSGPTQILRTDPPAHNPSPFAFNPLAPHADSARNPQPLAIAPSPPTTRPRPSPPTTCIRPSASARACGTRCKPVALIFIVFLCSARPLWNEVHHELSIHINSWDAQAS